MGREVGFIMPGRLALFDDSSFRNEARIIFTNIKNKIRTLKPTYNIAPTHTIPVLLNTKIYVNAHFGLIPSWAKDKKSININARSETLFEKNSFRDSFKSRRCLIPINGFYEWEKKEKEKIPYFIHPYNEGCFVLAGLWDEWIDGSTGETIIGVALITTEPNDAILKIHDRMPVILDKKNWATWLDEKTKIDDLNRLLTPCSNKIIIMREVSSLVNSVSNNSKECIEKQCIEKHMKETSIQRTLF
jgi:putative SOS response-associated peptidase YedK